MNSSTSVPPKPQYKEINSLHHMMVRQLVPFVNASRALEKEMLASDNFCNALQAWEQTASPYNCSVMNLSRTFQKRFIDAQAWADMPKFPLPSNYHIDMMRKLSARFSMAIISFFILLADVVTTSLATLLLHRITRCRYLNPSSRRSYLVNFWQFFFWPALCITIALTFGTYTWRLTYIMAKDKFIDTCMSYKVGRSHYLMNIALI